MTLNNINDQNVLSLLSDVKIESQKLFDDKLLKLIQFGSYARNQQDKESDINIMILFDGCENRLKNI